MKELVVVIGLVLLGAILVSVFVLGDNGLQGAAESFLGEGIDSIEDLSI